MRLITSISEARLTPCAVYRILEKGQARFSFVNKEDPFHAYYQHKLSQIKSGAVSADSVAAGGSGTPLGNGKDSTPASTQVPDDGRPKVPQPPPFDFLLQLPTLSAEDFDVMKLTALFAARNGNSFQAEIARREHSNYQFDFLRRDHTLYPVYQQLVAHYTKILVLDQKRVSQLRCQAGLNKGADVGEKERKRLARKALKSEVADRVAWTAWEAERKQQEEDEAEARRIAFAEVDWQDFVVVATVEFTQADDEAELDPPKTLAEVVNMSMRDKHRAAMLMEGKTLPTEADEEQVRANAQKAIQQDGADQEMDMDEDEEPGRQIADQIKATTNAQQGNVKIRPKDYVPKCECYFVHRNLAIIGTESSATAKRNAKTGLTKCEICGEMIPNDDLSEHVRIELLDPRWKEKQQVAEHNRAASNMLGTGADVAASLRKIAQQRTDIFSEAGMTDAEKRQQAEEELKRKAKEREAIVWDGHIASAEMSAQRYQSSANLDSQISALHKAKGLTEDANQSRIGPNVGAANDVNTFPPSSGATISAAPQASLLNPNAPQMYNPYGVPLMQPGQTSIAGQAASSQPSSGFGRPAEEAPEGQPDAKRARMARGPEGQFYDENSWLETHPDPVSIYVQMPESADKPEYNVTGQVITLSDVPLTALVSTLRERIHAQTQVPPGKQQIKWNDRILSNKNTLASYNFENGERLSLHIKKK